MNPSTEAYIEEIRKQQIEPGVRALAIYDRFVTDSGLFGQAYYGHRATPKQRRQLTKYWKLAMKLGGMDAKGNEKAEARPTRKSSTDNS